MLLLDSLERQTLTDRQVVAIRQTAGDKTQLPDLASNRAALDAALVEESQALDTDEMQLRRALGVG